MAMNYRTRGMSSPQGKARVYFCCYPEDFETYFGIISNEILRTQDCAIWYDTSDVPLDEERQLELGQMQLFVMPITTRLLTTPNRALAEEFPFAVKSHIPVLPIMMEGGLEELYSKKFGDLQFLDKTAHDPTAISYEEKLEKYLSSVLIGDELAAKVRDAFDAYIFLSYRKKDRKYAQELMRRIHQNDFCRDVAIWYDEYLTLGEDFNKTITEILKKSDLFALAVTPTLLEMPNYVLTEEYPEAVKSNKPILPVEVLSTDIKALTSVLTEAQAPKRDGVPNCIRKDDEAGLSTALLDSLRHIALRENDSDPQHNFFIGLAYLNGIDVEVDHNRARELITGAAEANLPEAVKKLVEMYRTGAGAARDYRKAIRWQKKLVDLRRADYEREKGEENGHILVYGLWDLGDFEKEIGNLVAAKTAYQQMLEISSETAVAFQTIQARRDLSISYEALGIVDQALGNSSLARAHFEKRLALSIQIAEEAKTAKVRRDLLLSYSHIGDTYMTENNFSCAKKYYLKSLELSCQLAAETGTINARRDLSISYVNWGDICQAEGDGAQAQKYYGKSLEIFFQLIEETESAETRRDLSIVYTKLGISCQNENEITQAKNYYEKSLELNLQLAEENWSVDARQDLSIGYNNLGNICWTEGNLTQAKEYYERGLELAHQLAEETGMVKYQRNLSVSYDHLGNIYQAEGSLTQAKEYYQKAVEICRQLAEEIGTVESQRNLWISYDNLGNICRVEGNLTQGKEYYQKALELSRQLAKETGTVEDHDALAVSYYNIALVSDESGTHDMLSLAYKIWDMLCQKCPENPIFQQRLDMVKELLNA